MDEEPIIEEELGESRDELEHYAQRLLAAAAAYVAVGEPVEQTREGIELDIASRLWRVAILLFILYALSGKKSKTLPDDFDQSRFDGPARETRDEAVQWARSHVHTPDDTPQPTPEKTARWTEQASRTMATQAASKGVLETIDALPGDYDKMWISRGDTKVRETHRKLHGVVVGLSEPFWRWPSGQTIQFPGDPSAPLDQIINCRCILFPVVKGMAKEAEKAFKPADTEVAFDIALAASAAGGAVLGGLNWRSWFRWDPDLHPRDAIGQFIEVGDWMDWRDPDTRKRRRVKVVGTVRGKRRGQAKLRVETVDTDRSGRKHFQIHTAEPSALVEAPKPRAYLTMKEDAREGLGIAAFPIKGKHIDVSNLNVGDTVVFHDSASESDPLLVTIAEIKDNGSVVGVLPPNIMWNSYTGEFTTVSKKKVIVPGAFVFDADTKSKVIHEREMLEADYGFANANTDPTTAAAFKNWDGSWDKKRAVLHDRIVGETVNRSEPTDEPVFVMIAGGPSSGKSTAIESDAFGLPGRNEAVYIGADEIKAQIPEYISLVEHHRRRAAEFSHDESNHLTKRVLAETPADRSIVFDAVGDKGIANVKRKLALARVKERGIRTKAIYTTLPTDKASELSEARGIETGRYVPDWVIRQAHADIPKTFFDIVADGDVFDELYLVNTEKWDEEKKIGIPRPIFSMVDGKMEIHDEDLLIEFLDKYEFNDGYTIEDVKALVERSETPELFTGFSLLPGEKEIPGTWTDSSRAFTRPMTDADLAGQMELLNPTVQMRDLGMDIPSDKKYGDLMDAALAKLDTLDPVMRDRNVQLLKDMQGDITLRVAGPSTTSVSEVGKLQHRQAVDQVPRGRGFHLVVGPGNQKLKLHLSRPSEDWAMWRVEYNLRLDRIKRASYKDSGIKTMSSDDVVKEANKRGSDPFFNGRLRELVDHSMIVTGHMGSDHTNSRIVKIQVANNWPHRGSVFVTREDGAKWRLFLKGGKKGKWEAVQVTPGSLETWTIENPEPDRFRLATPDELFGVLVHELGHANDFDLQARDEILGGRDLPIEVTNAYLVMLNGGDPDWLDTHPRMIDAYKYGNQNPVEMIAELQTFYLIGIPASNPASQGFTRTAQEWRDENPVLAAFVRDTFITPHGSVAEKVVPTTSSEFVDWLDAALQIEGGNKIVPLENRDVHPVMKHYYRFELESHPGKIYAMSGDDLGEVSVQEWGDTRTIGALTWKTTLSKYRDGDGEIEAIGVIPEFRREGIATAMLEMAYDIDPAVHHSTSLTDPGEAWVRSVSPEVFIEAANTLPGDDSDNWLEGSYVLPNGKTTRKLTKRQDLFMRVLENYDEHIKYSTENKNEQRTLRSLEQAGYIHTWDMIDEHLEGQMLAWPLTAEELDGDDDWVSGLLQIGSRSQAVKLPSGDYEFTIGDETFTAKYHRIPYKNTSDTSVLEVRDSDGVLKGRLKWNTEDHDLDHPISTRRLPAGRIDHVWVHKDSRREGIATEMLAVARDINPKIHHSNQLTDDGKAWALAAPMLLPEDEKAAVIKIPRSTPTEIDKAVVDLKKHYREIKPSVYRDNGDSVTIPCTRCDGDGGKSWWPGFTCYECYGHRTFTVSNENFRARAARRLRIEKRWDAEADVRTANFGKVLDEREVRYAKWASENPELAARLVRLPDSQPKREVMLRYQMGTKLYISDEEHVSRLERQNFGIPTDGFRQMKSRYNGTTVDGKKYKAGDQIMWAPKSRQYFDGVARDEGGVYFPGDEPRVPSLRDDEWVSGNMDLPSVVLYRAEGSHDRSSYYTVESGLAGGWWTEDIAQARRYLAGIPGGKLYRVEVNESEVESRGLYKFITDPDVRARRQEVPGGVVSELDTRYPWANAEVVISAEGARAGELGRTMPNGMIIIHPDAQKPNAGQNMARPGFDGIVVHEYGHRLAELADQNGFRSAMVDEMTLLLGDGKTVDFMGSELRPRVEKWSLETQRRAGRISPRAEYSFNEAVAEAFVRGYYGEEKYAGIEQALRTFSEPIDVEADKKWLEGKKTLDIPEPDLIRGTVGLNGDLRREGARTEHIRPSKPSNVGQCYEVSGRFVMDNHEGTLTHGIIRSDGGDVGHSWTVLPDGYVYEPTTDSVYHPDDFERLHNPVVLAQYSTDEAFKMFSGEQHWGPYDEASNAWPDVYHSYADEGYDHTQASQEATEQILWDYQDQIELVATGDEIVEGTEDAMASAEAVSV